MKVAPGGSEDMFLRLKVDVFFTVSIFSYPSRVSRDVSVLAHLYMINKKHWKLTLYTVVKHAHTLSNVHRKQVAMNPLLFQVGLINDCMNLVV